jgi:hypothetical protein
MKIVVEYDQNIEKKIELKEAEFNGYYKIKLIFSDGTEQLVDFGTFLEKSQHPSIRKYLELNRFKSFKVVNGNLNWNDYDLIFPIADLYEGKI